MIEIVALPKYFPFVVFRSSLFILEASSDMVNCSNIGN
uniref:Uncharacterized protein n=1 Tax=Arundo donax TaxID=35708 RepID=A0A0A9BD86_ARUDO